MVNTKTDLARTKVVCADVKQWADEYDGPPFHAVLCDAPYHLGDAGFMSKDWDAGGADGVSCQPETWRGITQHLLPGAFLFVFAGTINDDLISVAMRRAGLRKHHKAALYHATGQGFPKATRTKADGWAGYRYGLQTLKPSVESILIFQKSYEGRPVDSITETGAGALWIEGARIQGAKGDGVWGTNQVNCQSTFNASPDNEEYRTSQHPSGRWPSNLLLAHIAPSICPTCDGNGCDACGGEGLVGGCRRVGEKRVKGSNCRAEHVGLGSGEFSKVYKQAPSIVTSGYVDSDGLETVADWDCVDGCAVRALGERQVDSSVFLHYNVEKQEINQCCESASIAIVNSVLDWQMSSGALVGFVVENADMPTSESGERLTLGDNKINEMGAGIDSGEIQAAENCTANLNIDGSGKWQMDPSQVDMTCTILTTIKQTMICPICNSCLLLNITLYINELERTTELSQTARKQGNASDVESIYQLPTSVFVRRGPITAIVKIVKGNISESGEREIPITTATTYENGERNNVSRFFFQASWSYEIAEQIERAAPVFYYAKSSRRERDSGLENFDEQPVRRLSGGEFAHNSITRKVSKNETVTRNPHPTCKPITLAKHLATLLLPPPEHAPRRLLIPFCGTMSEGIGAMLAGWEEIVGIDIVPSYCEIAEARLAWWTDWMSCTGSTDPKEILKSAKANPTPSPTQLNFGLE